MNRATARAVRLALPAALVATLALPGSVAAQAPTVTTAYPAVAVEPGGSTTFPLRVTTPTPERVDLAVSEAPEGWDAKLRGGGQTVDAVFTDPDTPPEVELEVDLPADVQAGTYRIVVTARTADGQSTLPLQIRVAEAAGGSVSLTTDFPELQGAADATFSFDLNLANDTPAEARFSLEATGAPEDWSVQVYPTSDQQATSALVEAGGTAGITVNVVPPENAAAGVYPITVRAQGGGAEATVDLGVEITGRFALSLTMPEGRLNARVTAGSTGTFTVIVQNDGSSPLQNVALSGQQPDGWELTFEPATIPSINPGDAPQVTARLTPSGQAVAGDYVVTVSANSADANDSIEVRTTVETSPLWGLVGILLIVAVVVGVGWVFQRYGRR